MTRSTAILRLFALLGVIAASAWSQTAQITGTVTDASGAAVPNTQITATNTETGVSRSSVTNEAGNYLITSLFPGKYDVSASSAGFKRMKREALTLAVEQVATLDFRIENGETKERVTVEATAVRQRCLCLFMTGFPFASSAACRHRPRIACTIET